MHAESIACVFLCTPDDGLGVHEPDPLTPEICYCKTIYGERNYKRLWLFQDSSKRIHTRSRREGKEEGRHATNTVVVREDASHGGERCSYGEG